MIHPPSTDPGSILAYRDRQIAVELVAAAIVHLDFFSWLDRGDGATTKQICDHFKFVERPVDVLLTLSRANGWIGTREGKHSLTLTGKEHLVRDSPWFLGPYFQPLKESSYVRDFLRILETGKPANWKSEDEGADWHESMGDEAFARDFTALMDCRGLGFGQLLAHTLAAEMAGRKRILDVGGGSGVYAAAMVSAHPHLEGIVLEKPPVDDIARKSIDGRGLGDRIDVVPADMFTDDWPGECDVHLLSNLLHDWDFPEIRKILEKSAASLGTGGMLVIHQAFLTDEKDGPVEAAEYSTLLMHITRGRCYSRGEIVPLLKELGFEPQRAGSTLAGRGFLTASKV